MSDYTCCDTEVELPMPGDETETINYICLFDFDVELGSIKPDKWTGEIESNEYTITRIQLEVSDGVWADLNKEHWHLLEKQLEKEADKIFIQEDFKMTTEIVKTNTPTSDFVDGQQDCRDGKQAEMSRSDYYQSGYAYEYELEQIRSAWSCN